MILKKIILLLVGISFYACKKEEVPNVDKQFLRDSIQLSFKRNMYRIEIDSVFKKYNFNGSVAVFQDSIEIYRKVEGWQDFKSKTTLSKQSIFPIGSISKQITAVLILKQIEMGKLTLNEPFSKYLVEFQNTDLKNSTIEQLLNHTSGVTDVGNGLQSEPGKEFNYSNKGYYYLGKILENVTKKSFTENAEELFDSLGMRNTYTALNLKSSHFASSFVGNEKYQERIAEMPERLAEENISIAAGGILSTVDDLHRWNQLLYAGKIIKPELLEKFTTPNISRAHPIFGKMEYGYGIMIHPTNPSSYFHSGYVKGAPALNVYFPHTKTSVIILSNIADENKGKNAFFQPHKEIYKLANTIELATK